MDMTLEEIQETRDSTPPVRKLAAIRVSALRKASLYGMTPPPLHVLEPDLEGSHLAVSTAQRGAKSFVDNPETPQALSLERGLTLFGLNEDAGPVVLSHWDTCADGVDEAALAGYSFQKDIGRLRAHFGAFIVMAHDSAVCGKRDLAGLFAGSRFREWRDIGFRTPYLGVVTASGKTHEFTGDVDEEIAVELGGLFGRDRKKTTFMQRQSAHLPRVAHAGGAYEGQTYTNSLDALDLNRDRYQLFEIDLSWTSDGHLVCLHDWKASWGKDEEKKDSLEVFLRTSARRKGPAGCTLETLADWMRSNPSASIVTDVKEDNIRALAKIAHDHPALKPRFIPQIYTPAEYRVARSLGFEDIIWTLYRMHIPEKQILGHLRYMDLFALTMPVRRAETGLAKRAAEATGVLSYVHTLNSAEEFEHFRALGVNSLYTDFLSETEAPTR